MESLLSLVRLVVGQRDDALPNPVNWEELMALASEQGLLAFVLDGLDWLPPTQCDMPSGLKLRWIGEVLQGYEHRYDLYRRAIAEMAAFYGAHGYKMMVLKGFACSLDWPKPEHRPCGDIDIWQFGQYREADALLEREKGIKVDTAHHHHTVFCWRGFTVENHYDFVNVYVRKSSRELEKIFKRLGEDDSHFVEVGGEKVYLPSPDLHALFLLRHAVSHFASTNLNLRQILDWGFFVKAHTAEIDWVWLLDVLERFHMRDFFYCLNAICVEDLGFDASLFPAGPFEPAVKERMLSDMLSPEFAGREPEGLMRRIVFKFRRWQANAWKQRLCYPESRWSAFWRGVWSHLLKPGSI